MCATHVLNARRFTVEPGLQECRMHIDPRWGGGFGCANPIGTKFYDYQQSESGTFADASHPSLADLLSIMERSSLDDRFYSCDDTDAMKDNFKSYLREFVGKDCAKEIKNQVTDYASRAFVLNNQYTNHVVVGTSYFNDIFYATSYKVAQKLFSPSLLDACIWEFSKTKQPGYPNNKLLVNCFDGTPRFIINTDGMSPSSFKAINQINDFMATQYCCSEDDYQRSIKPYIMFLSGWTLRLGCQLAMEQYEQCAFGVFFE